MQHAIYSSLAGKRVVITGGGTGIGVAIVEAFARQGAHVTFLDIANEPSRALQETLAHLPQPPVFRYCDLTDLGALAATFAEIEHSALAAGARALIHKPNDVQELCDTVDRLVNGDA